MQIFRKTLPSAALLLHRELEHPSLPPGLRDEEGAYQSGSNDEPLGFLKSPRDRRGAASAGEDVTVERGKWRT
jgi:hypothetical protein